MAGVGLDKDVTALFMLRGCPDTDRGPKCAQAGASRLRSPALYVRNCTIFGISLLLMVSFHTIRRIGFSYNVLSQFHCVSSSIVTAACS